MAYLALFFLGLLQGLTEFLPVSSSGHLVLFSKLFGIEESLFLSILLHVATLLSVVCVFYKDIWEIIKHPFSKQSMQLVIATLFTGAIVLALMPIVKKSFSGAALPLCFAISAVILFASEVFSKKTNKNSNYLFAIIMGVAQGFAVFPGISRSGTTISAGLIAGEDKQKVAKFSFVMSIPIIIMSMIMEIIDVCKGEVILSLPVLPTIIAFVTAFLVGIFAIKMMIKITANSNLKWFAFYLMIISIVSLFVI